MPNLNGIAGAANTAASIVGVVVPAVQQLTGVISQIVAQARARGWDIDTRSFEESAAKFDAIVALIEADKARDAQ